MFKNIIILGGTGLLGTKLLSGKYLKDYNIICLGRKSSVCQQVDFMNKHEIATLIKQIKPAAIINLIALTDVDHCEKFPNEAFKINVKILEIIVEIIKSMTETPFLVHISTDQVYDGNGPFSEKEINLNNYYAFSKYCSELIASKTNSIVLRTNFFGKSQTPKRRSFSDWLYQNLIEGKDFKVFEDVKFSPISMDRLCHFIANAVELKTEGIYNIGSEDGVSKADFAFYFANCLNLNTSKMKRTKISEANFLNCYRPRDMRLNLSKFKNNFNFKLLSLTQEIESAIKEYEI